jgi:prepilin-type N-terminal cleavage/methylation domain-containing protein
MENSRGTSLMEMVVVIAVIAILASILTPMVNGYVDRARYTAAQNDVRNIAAAIVQFNADTHVWPIYTAASEVPNGETFKFLETVGEVPSVAAAIEEGWGSLTSNGDIGSLDNLLNTNFLNLPTSGNGAFKGAYLNLGTDPWSSRYYVTAANLSSTSMNAAFVLSAGPDRTIDTDPTQLKTGTFTVGNDDIIQRIR